MSAPAACTATCHCGKVKVVVPALPDEITRCNCTLCTKLGTRWAYFQRADVIVSGDVVGYRRCDMVKPFLETMRCAHCGCVTHWQSLDASLTRCGVNVNLISPALIEGLPVRAVDMLSQPVE